MSKKLFFLVLSVLLFNSGHCQTIWIRQIGGTGIDGAYAVTVDSLSNTFVTGEFENSVSIGSQTISSVGNSDIFLAKLDKNGKFLWQKHFGGSQQDYATGVKLDKEGNCFLTGRYESASLTIDLFTLPIVAPAQGRTLFIAKFDTNGNLLWAKNIPGAIEEAFGFDVNEKGESILFSFFIDQITIDGKTLLANGTGIGFDLFVMSLDEHGNFRWGKALQMPEEINNVLSYWPCAATIDNSGKGYISGGFRGTLNWDGQIVSSDPGNFDLFVGKIDDSGLCEWIKSAKRTDPFPGGRWGEYGALKTDSLGSLFMSGVFYRDFAMDGYSFVNSNQTDSTTTDIFLLKLNADGAVQWATSFGGNSYDSPRNIVSDLSGNILVSCFGSSSVTIGTKQFSGNFDYPFFTKFSSEGTFLTADKVGETFVNTLSMDIDPDGSLLFGGGFTGKFEARPNSFSLTNHSNEIAHPDAFVMKYRLCEGALGIPDPITGTDRICPGEIVNLKATVVEGASYYLWQVDDKVFKTTLPKLDTVFERSGSSTQLIVKITAVDYCENNGNASSPFLVNFNVVDVSQTKLTDVFTPNQDAENLNEKFELDLKLAGSRLKIFNRWGQMIYQSEAYQNDWRAEDVPTGVYYYELEDGCHEKLKSILTIFR